MRLVACLRACMCLWYACNHLHAFLYSCSAGYLRICWLVSLNVQWLCIRMLEWFLSICLVSCILDFLCGCITHLHTVSCMHASMYIWMPIWLCIFVLCSCVVRVRICSCVPVYASVDIVSRITVTDCMFYCVSAQQDGQFVRLHVCMVELPMTVCLYTRVDAGLYVCMPCACVILRVVWCGYKPACLFFLSFLLFSLCDCNLCVCVPVACVLVYACMPVCL